MAGRENLDNGKIRLTLSMSEQIILAQIIDKISRDKTLTSLYEYKQAGAFHSLLELDLADGTYRIPL